MNFSFIIPVYNCRDLLPFCIHSILDSHIPSCEIILINDGSTDGSASLCDALARSDSSIRVLHQENAGVSAARNAGLSIATGKYILFVDGDDTLDPSLFRELLLDPDILENDLTIFGTTFDYYRKGICYRRESCCWDTEEIMNAAEWGSTLPELFRCNALSPLWNKIYRRDILQANNLQLNRCLFLYEDLDFVLRYMACCREMRMVPKPVYRYRQAEDEGNARRRIKKIHSIPEYIQPIEASLQLLLQKNPAISLSSAEDILQQLHQILAREKIAGSGIREIRSTCCAYSAWEAASISSPHLSGFRNDLVNRRIWSLWLQSRFAMLRHRIAVSVKAHLHERKQYGH